MNKLQLLVLISLISNLVSAQFGINTSAPSGIVHIDGARDNPIGVAVSNPSQLNNDVVMNKDGFIGVGKLPETKAKVSITTNSSNAADNGKGFRLKDGTQGNGNLLSLSNTAGDVVWTPRVGTVRASLAPNIKIPLKSDLVATNTTITLPPGKWLIRSTLILRAEDASTAVPIDGSFANGAYARLSWADKNTDGTYTPTADALSGNIFGGSYYSRSGLAFGQTILYNNTSTAKIYHLITRTAVFFGTGLTNKNWRGIGGANWGENAIIAFPAN